MGRTCDELNCATVVIPYLLEFPSEWLFWDDNQRAHRSWGRYCTGRWIRSYARRLWCNFIHNLAVVAKLWVKSQTSPSKIEQRLTAWSHESPKCDARVGCHPKTWATPNGIKPRIECLGEDPWMRKAHLQSYKHLRDRKPDDKNTKFTKFSLTFSPSN